MTDAELRDAAVASLKRTTISFPEWQRRVATGRYADVTKTEWGRAFDALGKIGAAAPPPLPPPPALSIRDRVGVCMWQVPYSDTQADLTSGIAATGAGVVRFDFAGSVIRPNSTTWRWDLADKGVAWAAAAGVKVLAVCSYAPSWMNGGKTNDKYPPLDAFFAQYAQVAAEVEKRYGDKLMGVETWNEPWLCSSVPTGAFWLPYQEPARFLTLSKAQAEAVWAVNPNRDVAVSLDYWGQGVNNGKQFASAVVAADTTGFLRHPRVVISTHTYCESAAPTDPRTTGWAFDRWKLARSQSGNPRAWVTEMGWKAPGDVDEARQADYTDQGFRMAFADGVERMFVFGVGNAGISWGYNLRRSDGSWKPAAAKLKLIAGGQ